MKIRLALISGLLAAFLCTVAQTQSYEPFPGSPVDHRTRKIQERVEELYAAAEFKRALFIYKNELAPTGDKYAQYMVGYMYLSGEGTQRDTAEALAWYRLAAERGESLLLTVRDDLIRQLPTDDIRRSDERYLALWKSIGDRKLILKLIEDDLETLRSQTGTRISRSSVNRANHVFKTDGQSLGPNFYGDVGTRLNTRIQYLESRVDIIDDILVAEIEKTRQQEAKLRAQLAALENR